MLFAAEASSQVEQALCPEIDNKRANKWPAHLTMESWSNAFGDLNTYSYYLKPSMINGLYAR